MEAADFSGYATKAGLKCADGRTITAEAFKHMDGMKVPLVWQHGHDDPDNILGHAYLEAREDGVYAYGFFNETPKGQNSKVLVQHGDIVSLSIYANKLVERNKQVFHGSIREVSLVISGANPGAVIEQVKIAHSDDPNDVTEIADEALIFTGLSLEHSQIDDLVDEVDEDLEDLEHDDDDDDLDKETIEAALESMTDEQKAAVHAMVGAALIHADGDAGDDETAQDVYNTFSDKQKKLVHYMIGVAVEAAADGAAAHSDTQTDKPEGDLTHQEGNTDMTRNVFDQTDAKPSHATLSHTDIQSIFAEAKKSGSFKDALMHHIESSDELKHSITDIELLFPDAQAITTSPEFISRRMEWVSKVLTATKKSPFAKVKTLAADITADEARAKGYVKGNQKVEEVLTLLRRTTGPTTIYKLQKLDRDDVVDITDIDVVLWLKAEMRLMIEEELARAILVGDGRSAVAPDKIKDPAGANSGDGIRSILNDSDLYAVKAGLAANVSAKDAVKGLVRARSKYRGSGKPTLFVSDNFLTDIMLEEDKFGRALYETEQALRDKLRVSDIITVEIFDQHPGLLAIMVNLADYTIGANRGGELTSFEDFDLNFNKYEYLQETRLSGGLTKPFSAVVVTRAEGTLATPEAPSFDGTTDTITIPTVTGVAYFVNDAPVADGAAIVITGPTEVTASPKDGYYFVANTTTSWTYTP